LSILCQGGSGPFSLGAISNSSLQIPQGSPFALTIPIIYNYTYASNFVFTITNNNPSQIGLCSAYVEVNDLIFKTKFLFLFLQNASAGFSQLPTLGYEISTTLTTALTNNQISINLGQIVNTRMCLFLLKLTNSSFFSTHRILQWFIINSLYRCLWASIQN
jgi:hypothetical protein